MLDQAFETLKTYDWGQDRGLLEPIDEAVVAARAQPDGGRELENRLAAVLQTDASHDAKQFVCRKLMVIGTAAAVPALAPLLSDEKLSHMARYALERMDAPEAGNAMRDALPSLNSDLKIGVIGSLGVRGENASVPPLKDLLGADDSAVARAAALALGAIRSPEAAQALTDPQASADAQAAIADASLACAESLLAAGDKSTAKAVYQRLLGDAPPKHVRLAATRGMLACAGS